MNRPLHIFIIDDDPVTRYGIKKILNRDINGAALSEFKNGKLALLTIKHFFEKGGPYPDVIFLDINMPIMDGWEFLGELIPLDLDKKIIINILTSSIDPLDTKKFEFYKSNCHHYLNFVSKPLLKISKDIIIKKDTVL